MVKKFKFGLFVKILLFYICALLIPFLICGSFLTQHIMSSYKNEILDLNVNTTNYIRRMIDENIDDVDVIKILISQNELIMDFIKNDNLSYKQKAYSAKQVAAEIEKYRIYKNSIRAIHLYSRASDCIIAQNTYYTKEEYFDRFLMRSGTSFEEWCENLEGSRRDSIPILSLMDYSSADDYNSVTTATIMQPVISDNKGNSATLLIVLDAEHIINTYNDLVSAGYAPYFAIASATDILIESDEAPVKIDVESLLNEDIDNRNSKNGYITVTSKSQTSGLNYICIMSEREILGRVRSMNKFLILCIGIMSLILIILAYVFSNKTFMPIKILSKMEIVEKKYSFDSVREFQGFLVNIINSNNQLSEVVSKQKQCINDNLFKSFIQNSMFVDESTLNTLFADTLISVNSKSFRVAIVDFKTQEKEFNSTESINIISDFQDILKDYNISLCVVPNENKQIILLLAGDNGVENVRTAFLKIVNHLDENENIHTFISVGRTVDSLNRFTKSYEDALFNLKNNENKISVCEGTSNISYVEYFNFIKKDKLVFDIRSGNEKEVKKFFEELKSGIFINYTTTYGIQNYARYLLDGIFKEAINTELLSVAQVKKYLINCGKAVETQDIIESFEQMEECFVGATQCISEGKQEKKNDVINDIINYIKENYAAPDLSLKQIAEELNITSYKYISEAFKNRVGMKFTDYLHEVRNEEAKRLLLTTDLMGFEIAERIGYLSSNAFVKNFKKLNGITPGDFRKSGKI